MNKRSRQLFRVVTTRLSCDISWELRVTDRRQSMAVGRVHLSNKKKLPSRFIHHVEEGKDPKNLMNLVF